jgi:hypothetical protein
LRQLCGFAALLAGSDGAFDAIDELGEFSKLTHMKTRRPAQA